jgi:RNA polymerase sigma-70 factor (subfamily 1)
MRWQRHFEAETLLTEARQGIRESLGRLLQTYANYIKLVAAAQVGARLKVRVSPSDVVQETFLQAHRTFDQFRGRTEAEFLAWLQRILASQLTHLYEKHILAEKRDARREVSLDVAARCWILPTSCLMTTRCDPVTVGQRTIASPGPRAGGPCFTITNG